MRLLFIFIQVFVFCLPTISKADFGPDEFRDVLYKYWEENGGYEGETRDYNDNTYKYSRESGYVDTFDTVKLTEEGSKELKSYFYFEPKDFSKIPVTRDLYSNGYFGLKLTRTGVVRSSANVSFRLAVGEFHLFPTDQLLKIKGVRITEKSIIIPSFRWTLLSSKVRVASTEKCDSEVTASMKLTPLNEFAIYKAEEIYGPSASYLLIQKYCLIEYTTGWEIESSTQKDSPVPNAN